MAGNLGPKLGVNQPAFENPVHHIGILDVAQDLFLHVGTWQKIARDCDGKRSMEARMEHLIMIEYVSSWFQHKFIHCPTPEVRS